MKARYTVAAVHAPPAKMLNADDAAWREAERARVSHYHPAGSGHAPEVILRAIHDKKSIYVLFEVHDRYVRSVVTERHGPVCTDSCVEFFVRPTGTGPYYNFEVNAGGTLLASRIEDWSRTGDGFATFACLSDDACDAIVVETSLPRTIEPEHSEPLAWRAAVGIPFTTFKQDALPPATGDCWTANFYKCGDKTSHSHWGAWSPIGDSLNFHQPAFFGELCFG